MAPLLDRIGDMAEFLAPDEADAPTFAALRKAETTGRPLCGEAFIKTLERRLARASPRPPRPKAAL